MVLMVWFAPSSKPVTLSFSSSVRFGLNYYRIYACNPISHCEQPSVDSDRGTIYAKDNLRYRVQGLFNCASYQLTQVVLDTCIIDLNDFTRRLALAIVTHGGDLPFVVSD